MQSERRGEMGGGSERETHCVMCGHVGLNPGCPLRGLRKGACRMASTMSWDEFRVWKAERKQSR